MGQRGTSSQYMRLAEHLLQQVRDGIYAPGDLLPSENELCAHFEISRITARGALKELEIRGVVSRRPGIGTRVLEPAPPRPVFTHAGGSVDDVLQFTRGIPFKPLGQSEITVTPAMARELDLPQGQRFTRIQALRRLDDGSKLASSQHYVPVLLTPPAALLARLRNSLAQCIAECHGDEIQTIRQQMGACLLGKADAQLLEQPVHTAAVTSHRWYSGREGRLLLLSVSVFPAELYTFDSVLLRNIA